jgi:REP element-mobilizing transposase RayT
VRRCGEYRHTNATTATDAMGYARKSLVSLEETPYYHVIARCVRRAWLCGFDQYAGKDYSHRKRWVLQRMQTLATAFTIDVCAYAIMSNHYHLVLHVDRARARQLSHQEIVARWGRLFGLPPLLRQWQRGRLAQSERPAVLHLIERWRERLSDISWYMRCLNEYLARRANAEDACTGRFWEGRFKSQALLDEAGLLTAMAYVELNPVRAGLAPTPEASTYTSLSARLQQLRRAASRPARQVPLLPFQEAARTGQRCLPTTLRDYLQLLDWTGRAVRPGKRGAIESRVPPILIRLRIEPQAWQATMARGGTLIGRALGRLARLRRHAELLGQCWIKGLTAAAQLYQSA